MDTNRETLAKLIRETNLNPVKIYPNSEMVKASREAAARADCLTTKEFLKELRGKEKTKT